MRFILALAAVCFLSLPALAQTAEDQPENPLVGPMTASKLMTIIRLIDSEARVSTNAAELTIQDIPVIVIADEGADRMRAMVPIRSASELDDKELMRLMQANFDSALDARYAVADGRLWGVFIHPLAPLEHRQFLSGLLQTVNVARSYGTAYSGGGVTFGGGDSNEIFRKQLEDLLDKSEEL